MAGLQFRHRPLGVVNCSPTGLQVSGHGSWDHGHPNGTGLAWHVWVGISQGLGVVK